MKYNLLNHIKKTSYCGSIVLSIVLASIFLLFSAATPSYAIDTVTISAHPTAPSETDPRTRSWFIYTLPGGVQRADSVTVVNNSNQPLSISVYAVDSVKTSDNGFGLANVTEPKTTVGAWVKMSTNEVTLGPKERKDIPFTISIPLHAALGDYSGGIVFQLAPEKSTATNGMGINVISRVGVRIYETVPGNNQLNIVVNNLHYAIVNNALTFTFTAENKGTVHVSPTGMLEVDDMFGRQVNAVSLNSMLDTLVPGKPVTFSIPTHALSPILGFNMAHVALYYSPTLVASASTIVLPPVWSMFVFFLIILLAVGYILVRKFDMIKTVKGKETKTKQLTSHTKIIVGAILVGVLAFSWIVSFLLNFFFGTK